MDEELAGNDQGSSTKSFYKTTSGVKVSDCTDSNKKGACYFLTKYFDVVKECSSKTDTNCVSDVYTALDGSALGANSIGDYCVRTKSGVTLCMDSGNHNILIDINGSDAPNISGLDLFKVHIEENGDVTDKGSISSCGAAGTVSTSTDGCVKKVITNNWSLDKNLEVTKHTSDE